MPLSPEEQSIIYDKYKELVEFYYAKAREIIVAHERLTEDQKLCMPAITETRSAFEHIMRVKALIFGCVKEEDILENTHLSLKEYCLRNIDKAHGHLYRAAYDAYDVIAFKFAKDIQNIMKNISYEAAFHIIPDFNSRVNKPYQEALKLVTKGKLKKDVGSKNEEEKEFSEYENAANKLRDVIDILNDYMPQMTMYVREIEKNRIDIEKSKFINKWGLIIGIIAGVIGLISLVLTILYC